MFVTPTSLQLSIFSKILHPTKLDDLAQSSTAESLALITMLTKVSNSPVLLKATADKAKAKTDDRGNPLQKASLDDALKLLPEGVQIDDVSLSGEEILIIDIRPLIRHMSGKLIALSSLLQVIRSVRLFDIIHTVRDSTAYRELRRNASLFRIIHQLSISWKRFVRRRATLTIGWTGKHDSMKRLFWV